MDPSCWPPVDCQTCWPVRMSSFDISRTPSVVRTCDGIGGACRYTSRPKKPRMKNARKSVAPKRIQSRPCRAPVSEVSLMMRRLLFVQRPPEQHMVLEVDVLHQLLFELLKAEVQRAPRHARLGRWNEVRRQRSEDVEVTLVVVVLQLQHLHRPDGRAALAEADQREEDLLLFLEVVEHLDVHVMKVGREPPRARPLVTVPGLDLFGHRDELRQREPQPGV